jgi:hypothetical protein
MLLDRTTEEWTSCEDSFVHDMICWSPDSRYIFFSDRKLYRVRIEGRSGRKLEKEEFADMVDFGKKGAFFWGGGGWWHGFDPGGKLLAMRPPRPAQIHVMDLELPE